MDDLKTALTKELRDLRKGRGLTLARLADCPKLLTSLNADTVQSAFDELVAIIMSLGDDIRPRALQNAYGINAKSDLLTARREDYALTEQRHADTIEAYENAMIDELVHKLLNTAMQGDDHEPDKPWSFRDYASVRFDLTIVNGYLANMSFTGVDGYVTYETVETDLKRTYAIGYVDGAPLINVHFQVVAVGTPIEAFSVSEYKDHINYSTQPHEVDDILPVKLDTPLLITLIGRLNGTVIEFRWH